MWIARRIMGTFFVRGASAIASLLFAALLVRVYSLEKFGEFTFALATVRIVSVLCVASLDSLLLRMQLRNPTGQERLRLAIAQECMANAQVLGAVGAVAVALAALIGMQFWNTSFWFSLGILSPIVLLQGSTALQANILRAGRKDVQSQWVAVGITAIAPLAVIAPLSTIGETPYLLPEFVFLGSQILAALVGWRLSTHFPPLHIRTGFMNFQKRKLRVLRFSLNVHAANMMNFAIDWYGQSLVIGLQSFESVGILRIFQQLAAALALAAQSVEIPFSSEVASAHNENDFKRMRKLLEISQIILGLVGAVAIIVIYVLWEPFANLVRIDPDRYLHLLLLFLMFYWIVLLTGAAASTMNLINATAKLVLASKIAFATGFVVLTVSIPFFGLAGAIVGLGSSVALRALLNYYFVRTELHYDKR